MQTHLGISAIGLFEQLIVCFEVNEEKQLTYVKVRDGHTIYTKTPAACAGANTL